MFSAITPDIAALVEVAAHAEWAWKTDVSTPASSRQDFNHLAKKIAIVLENTALCRPIKKRKRRFSPSSCQKSFALSSYALSVTTGHKHSSSLKAGKKTSVSECEGRDCFDKWEGLNMIPCEQKNLLLRSKAARSASLHGWVRAN